MGCRGGGAKNSVAAKTPHQRVITSEAVDQRIKDNLDEQYERLDPVALLEKLEELQSKLFEYSWSKNDIQKKSEPLAMLTNLIELPVLKNTSSDIDARNQDHPRQKAKLCHYRYTKKTESNKRTRDWRTRKDTFERVWDEIKLKLGLNPEQTAKALLNGLMVKYPSEFKPCHLRTLQRRVLHWRRSQLDQEARLRTIMRPHETNVL